MFHADQPCYRNGNRVQGVTLRFWKGRAELVSADEGGEFVRAQLSMDAGACQLGEFSLTDKRFSRIDAFMAHTLFDENYAESMATAMWPWDRPTRTPTRAVRKN